MANRDRVDLDARIARKPRNLDGRARRIRLIEVFAVDAIHSFEVGEIGEKDCRPDNVAERQAGCLKYRAEILQHATRLEFDSAEDQRTALGIESNLPRAINCS